MSTLRNRIMGKHSAPVPQSAATTKDYGTPDQIPLIRIATYFNGTGYDEPIIAADGAPIKSTGPGQWGQLYRAGR